MAPDRECARFAPSTTGRAHPGTLLAALLCWLDARSRQARLCLRLEDLDPQRCRPAYAQEMIADLAWLGLDWDEVQLQSELGPQHQQALDSLERQGLLYPSPASREQRRQGDASGGPIMEARRQPLPTGGWRSCHEPVRVRLPSGLHAPSDEGGLPLAQQLTQQDDPVVVRRDGAVAYQLAVVVDDAAAGVTRVVRGRDIASSSAVQMALRRLLGYREPSYRHHLLLLEERGRKFAKLHGSIALPALRARYDAPALCGFLASCAGLCALGQRLLPRELLPAFSWQRVPASDVLVRWDGQVLSQHRLDGEAGDPAIASPAAT